METQTLMLLRLQDTLKRYAIERIPEINAASYVRHLAPEGPAVAITLPHLVTD